MESRALAVALVSLGPWGVGAEFSLSHAECQVETSPAGSTSLVHVRNTSVYVYEDILGGGAASSLNLEVWGLEKSTSL